MFEGKLMHRYIRIMFGILPIIGVCRRCIEKHKNCFKNNADMKEELKEICFLLERTTNSEAMDADGSFFSRKRGPRE